MMLMTPFIALAPHSVAPIMQFELVRSSTINRGHSCYSSRFCIRCQRNAPMHPDLLLHVLIGRSSADGYLQRQRRKALACRNYNSHRQRQR